MFALYSNRGDIFHLFTDNWNGTSHPFKKLDFGKWQIEISAKDDGSCAIPHLSRVKVCICNMSNIFISFNSHSIYNLSLLFYIILQ